MSHFCWLLTIQDWWLQYAESQDPDAEIDLEVDYRDAINAFHQWSGREAVTDAEYALPLSVFQQLVKWECTYGPTPTSTATATPEPTNATRPITPTPTPTVDEVTNTPTPTATPEPTAVPTEVGFGPGTYLVGERLQPGIYAGKTGTGLLDSCYWARLSGASGEFSDLIANDNAVGQYFVSIQDSDYAFATDCALEMIEALSE